MFFFLIFGLELFEVLGYLQTELSRLSCDGYQAVECQPFVIRFKLRKFAYNIQVQNYALLF